MDSAILQFKKKLKEHNLSASSPRIEVFSVLFSLGLQTMNQLISRAQQSDRASIYRAVEVLCKIGVVRKVSNGFRYKLELSDPYFPHHHHITCTSCASTSDIEQELLEELLVNIANDKNFLLSTHSVELLGLCQNCRS